MHYAWDFQTINSVAFDGSFGIVLKNCIMLIAVLLIIKLHCHHMLVFFHFRRF